MNSEIYRNPVTNENEIHPVRNQYTSNWEDAPPSYNEIISSSKRNKNLNNNDDNNNDLMPVLPRALSTYRMQQAIHRDNNLSPIV